MKFAYSPLPGITSRKVLAPVVPVIFSYKHNEFPTFALVDSGAAGASISTVVAEEAAIAIKKLRRKLKFPEDVEFKFNKSKKDVREQFLNTINKFNFKIRCLVINKSIIRSRELRNNKNSFYSYAIKTALAYNDGSILDAKVRIDGSGDRLFKRNFLTYLRRQLNTEHRKIMKNCQLINSKSNVLIQMADMIAGSIRRSYEGSKSDAKIYKAIIKKHIEDEWKFR